MDLNLDRTQKMIQKEARRFVAAELDSDILDHMTPLERPPDSSWLSWALRCHIQQWKERTERFVRDRAERLQEE